MTVFNIRHNLDLARSHGPHERLLPRVYFSAPLPVPPASALAACIAACIAAWRRKRQARAA